MSYTIPANEFKLDNQSGATLLEFAIIAPIFLGLIGVVVDISWSYFNYVALRYTVSKTLRELTVNVGEAHCTQQLLEVAESRANDLLNNVFGIRSDNYTSEATLEVRKSCSLRLRVKKESPCLFCIFASGTPYLTVNMAQVVSDECFDCSC